MEPPVVMTIKMFHCITVTAPTATAGKTVRVGGFSKTTNYIRKSFCSTIDIFRPNYKPGFMYCFRLYFQWEKVGRYITEKHQTKIQEIHPLHV